MKTEGSLETSVSLVGGADEKRGHKERKQGCRN